MTAFLVFRELPGVTRDQNGAAQQALVDVIADGFRVFRRRSAADVMEVNKQAGVPLTDVQEADDLRPAGPHPEARPLS